ncbi:ankyrin repeat and KH domain-containing protein mask isoform X4 [Scaptodrosophila lebanonensis]|uniref:Ankyrin repeat and KH domain-containing protein mask isoform X4 n=1 Tax=Drosophila lebanonensis TaxID=7225 RepID=A0A6J2TKV8_DROLE|nr:ankyrin repeat and KH domain-containing protein mask isoform X4 [Scaptodrosophila lebanonensis]
MNNDAKDIECNDLNVRSAYFSKNSKTPTTTIPAVSNKAAVNTATTTGTATITSTSSFSATATSNNQAQRVATKAKQAVKGNNNNPNSSSKKSSASAVSRAYNYTGPRIAAAKHSIAVALLAQDLKNAQREKRVAKHAAAVDFTQDLITTTPASSVNPPTTSASSNTGNAIDFSSSSTFAVAPPLTVENAAAAIVAELSQLKKTTSISNSNARLKVNNNTNATANTTNNKNNINRSTATNNNIKMSKTAANKTANSEAVSAAAAAATAAFVTAGTTTTPTPIPVSYTAPPLTTETTTTPITTNASASSGGCPNAGSSAVIANPASTAGSAAKLRAAVASAPSSGNTKKTRAAYAALKRQVAMQQQQQQTATSVTGSSPSASSISSHKDSASLKFAATTLLMGAAADGYAGAAVGASSSSSQAQVQAAAVASAAAVLKQKLKDAAASNAAANRSASSSTSSNSSSLSSSVGIVHAISTALQNIIATDTDTDTDFYPPQPATTDLSESEEESVSEILLAFLCLRPDLLDDIPESDPDSCPHEGGAREDEDETEEESEDSDESDGDDEEDDEELDILQDNDADDEDIDDEEDEDAPEVSNFERSSNISALNAKAPVLRHATHAIDETKQALTKMRCANSPRDKSSGFSRSLVAACTDNDVNTVKRLLCKGNVNLNDASASTDDGESLLSMACSAGYYELAQVLLAMSAAQVEDKGQKDSTPLMEAASAGHLDIVKLLLNHNADVNAHCATGNTPLMFACAGGHVDVVKVLLKHGANVEEQNENGHTPLMEAASAGHVEVAKVLLEHGAGINTHSNEFKESALTLACYKGHLDMVRFLLQAGADQEHKTDEMHTALMEASMDGHVEVARLLLDSGAQVNMPTDSFESPLTLAACGGHVELATLLIERGANIEEVNDEGYTPLMEAAREGHEEMVALLLSKGANINATTEETQETALTLACCGGFSEVAAFLIKEGANLELGASTPLMEASQEGHTDLVRFLLQNKANVHAETQTGDTALTHACENGHTDAAEVLLSYGAELEHESEGGRTPLMKACRAGHLCTVKFLIQKGANVNKQTTSNDHTPLSLACAGGHQSVVELLLKNNADPFHKLKDNSTMLIEASKGGHTRVVELLFRYPNISPVINSQTKIQQQLTAPPGLQELSEAARVSNQQLFHQQQFTGNGANIVALGAGDFLDTGELQLTATGASSSGATSNEAGSEEYVAGVGGIDLTTLSAQQQEGLIAKSRLFHLQPGFEQGLAQATLPPPGPQSSGSQHQSLPCKHFDLDMDHINSLTPPQKAPPAPPVLHAVSQSMLQVQQPQQLQPHLKMKGCGGRKHRQLHLDMDDIELPRHHQQQLAGEVRTQPLGEDQQQELQQQYMCVSEDPRLVRRRIGFLQEVKKTSAAEPLDANESEATAAMKGTDGTLSASGGSSECNAQLLAKNAGGANANISTSPITHSSDVLQTTAISDRPKVKASNKNNRKQTGAQYANVLPLQQKQMVSIYNNLQLQQQQELQLHQQMQHQQLQLQLQQHQNQRTQLENATTASTIPMAFSNSPASPLASPTGTAPQAVEQQQQLHLPPLEVGEAESHKTQMADFRGFLETAVNESLTRERNELGLNPASAPLGMNAPQLKFLKDGWMLGVHNFFGEHPKSPTETPPEMEETIMEHMEPRSEMKNLATLCSAAAVAAAVVAAHKDEISTDPESEDEEGNADGEGEPDVNADPDADGEENTLPPEPIELTEAFCDEEDDDEEDDTNSGPIEKSNYDEDDADVDYVDEEDDAGEDYDDELFVNDNVSVDQSNGGGVDSAGCKSVADNPAILPSIKNRKLSTTRLENLILSNVAIKPECGTVPQGLCDYRQDLRTSELVHVLPQISNIKAAAANNAALSVLQQQLAAAQAAAAQAKAALKHHQETEHQHQCDDEASVSAGSGSDFYPGLERFATDGGDGGHYDIAVEMEDIFQVLPNANEPTLQELASNLNYPELAEFSLNQMCKGRFASNWTDSPAKWSSQEQMLAAAHTQGLLNSSDSQQQDPQRQANLVLLDYPMQQRFADPDELHLQPTTVSLLPFSPEDAAAAVAAHQQQQQQLHPTLPPSANFVYNVEGSDKSTPPVQLLFQLPPALTQQPQPGDHQPSDTQQLQLQHAEQQLQEQQKQQLYQHRSPTLRDAERLLQQQQQTELEQVAQELLLQRQAGGNQGPMSQALKQKHFNLQEQLLLHPPPHLQTQTCMQHTQVQVGTQTHPSVVVPHATAQYAQFALQQQQQQHQQQQHQQPNELSIWPMAASVPTGGGVSSKSMPGGIAKKAIDKQSRKDRRCSGFRQTPAGSQVNTNQHQQPLPQQQPQLQNQLTGAAAGLEKTIEIDSETESNHDTALTLACAGGHEELVELLIMRHARIEHRDKKGFTPLILAATAGHEKVVDILLKHNAELEAQSERTKDTPLSLACSGGRYEVVELLLSKGANKEHRNVSDYTPLSLAASGGYVNIIKLLLSHGAEINSRTGSKLGISPLMLAAMNGHTAAVKLLLDQGSDINAQIETNRNTALTLACFQGRHEVVSLLLDRRANVEHRAKTGLTPLMEAASGGYIEVGRVLLDKGADVNAAPVPTSRDTALTIAADKGHQKFVELLLSRGASVEVKNKKGNSPLWLAAHGGHLSVVELLYNHNADIDSQDNRRVSCLMAAFRKGHTKIVKWMVQYVSQFPSDQEMIRFIGTISDKELIEKCYDCMKILRSAKEAQAVKANKNASILLEELDLERTREESRKAAAARRRERKKKKKMEKKEEKRRQQQASNGSVLGDDMNAEDDCDSDKDDDSDKDEEDEEVPPPREEGDSGIDQGSCSSGDTKAARGNVAQGESNNNNMSQTKKSKKQKNKAQANPQPPASSSDTATEKLPKVQATTSATAMACKSTVPAKKTPTIEGVKTTSQQVHLRAQIKKEDQTNRKKETANKREKENLAPKESLSVPFKQHQLTTNPAIKDKLISSESATNISSSSQRKAPSHSSTLQKHEDPKSSNSAPAVGKRCEVDGWKEVVRKSSTQQTAVTGAMASSQSGANPNALSSNMAPSNSSTSVSNVNTCNNNNCSTNNAVTSSNSSSSLPAAPEMTCKKVQVPVNAISRVIGRAGSNINAIRATTGAHIEVEKQGKNQSERSITIKGLTDATKQAHMLILALIKDPDVDILQMLPRINTSIKAATTISTPTSGTSTTTMTVGTWDNKTVANAVSAHSQHNTSNFSSAASTTSTSSSSSASSTPGSFNNLPNNGSKQQQLAVGCGSSKAQSTRGGTTKSLGATNKSNAPSGGSRGGQVNKAYFTQQQTTRGNTPANGVTTKSTKQESTQLNKSSTSTSNSSMPVKSSGQGKSSTTSQSFVIKGTSSGGTQSTLASAASPKKLDSGRGSGVVAPYGRGKPVTNVTASTSTSQLGNAGNNNTLAGPIGTFNAADVAAVNAAAAAAAAAVSNNTNNINSSSNVKARAVTPIAPPNKRSSSPLQTQQQQQKHQPQHTPSTSSQQNLVINTNILNDIMAVNANTTNDSFGAQLAAKLSSAYSLFSDYHQSQWGKLVGGDSAQCSNVSGVNSIVGDVLPQADASKAPGYNRNILSSPVGSSKASSNHSTSPPVGNVIQQQQQQNNNGSNSVQQALNIITTNAAGATSASSGGSTAARSPLVTDNASAAAAVNATVNGSQGVGDGNNVPTGHSPGVIKPPTAPIQRPGPGPVGSQIQMPASGSEPSQGNINFGAIGSTATSTVASVAPPNMIDRQQQPNLQRLLYDNKVGNTAQPMNYAMDPGSAYIVDGNILRINTRGAVFSQAGNGKNQQQAQGNQQQAQAAAVAQSNMFQSRQGAGGGRQPGVPGPGPQRWYGGTLEYPAYSGRDILHLENGAMAGMSSPSAMSPNHDDIRKMPRPIGTERASWKYNNFNVATTALNMDDGLATVLPPWAHEPKAQPPGLQQQAQPPNWMKQQPYRPYNNACAPYPQQPQHEAMNSSQQMPMDYPHMQPQHNIGQSQQRVNMMQASYGFQHFVGAPGAADMPAHMPEKVESWDHHEKHQPWTTYTTNWSN